MGEAGCLAGPGRVLMADLVKLDGKRLHSESIDSILLLGIASYTSDRLDRDELGVAQDVATGARSPRARS